MCLGGGNPIGRWFEKQSGNGIAPDRFQVIGVARDARYRNLREPITPTAYVPFASKDAHGMFRKVKSATFLARTSTTNPLAVASVLRSEMQRAQPALRLSTIRTQTELVEQHTLRERLLASLALFFATVAVLLAGIGLYGVLDYSVLQRRREIGIRMAVGAPGTDIAQRVTAEALRMVATGVVAGLAVGMLSVQYVESLLFGVKGNDPGMLALPSLTIVTVAVLAALPAVWRAVRVDPVAMLRSE